MRTPRNIIQHELIGLDVKIIQASNKSLVGISGRIVNETRNIFTIKTKAGEKRVQKKGARFMFKLNKKNVIVDGTLLVARPEDRIKLKLKRW